MTSREVSQLTMVGLSHRRACLGVLEQLTIPRAQLPELLGRLRSEKYAEAVVLSTCSRTEIYAVSDPLNSGSRLVGLLADHARIETGSIDGVVDVRAGAAAVQHLFGVTAGLESRVVGEVDVLAQVRLAYRAAQSAGMADRLLGRLFPAAMRSAIEVHRRTALGQQGRSLARRAVEVGLELLSGVESPQVLVVGSGQMAAVATARLAALGHRFRVAARHPAYAARLAGEQRVCPLADLVDGIRGADLLICATSASNQVVTLDHVRSAMAARSRALTVVDLSVPRNVDVAVAVADRVTLVDLATLHDDAASDPVVQAAVEAAGRLVAASSTRFLDDMAARDVGPLIATLRSRVEQTCHAELRRRAGEMSPETVAEVAHAITGKLLHAPTLAARAAASGGDTAALAVLCNAFGLQPET